MSRKLSVIQITSSGNRSGGTRQAILLSRGISERGHRVTFCAPPGSPALRWAQEEGIGTNEVITGGLAVQWRMSRRLRKLAQRTGADVVHAHHTVAHNVALMATFGGDFPPIVANRGVIFRPEFPLKFRTSRTAAVVTNSAAAKRILEEVGVSRSKIHVVYNAQVPPERETFQTRIDQLRGELDLEGPGPIVGAVGSGKPAKGFQFLVDAAPAILAHQPDARFVLVGGRSELLLPQIDARSLGQRFRLPGHRTDAREIMGLFDVFVIPSLFESCPNVLLEAMGIGVPCVGSNVGGIPELLEGGRLGRLVPAGDSTAIADGVCGLLSDPAAAAEMGRSARDAVLTRFSVRSKAEAMLAVYDSLLPPGR